MLINTTKKTNGLLFIISAPSGCGKTTLCKRLLKEIPGLGRSISYTTRRPRKSERNGVDYRFVSRREFAGLLKKGKLLEHAKVFGNLYGTPAEAIRQALKRKKDVLLSIDVKGAMQVKNIFKKESVLIFILPPSLATLRKRLIQRHADSKRQILKRLKIASEELSCVGRYDYAVVNKRLKDAIFHLKAIVTAEQLKRGRFAYARI